MARPPTGVHPATDDALYDWTAQLRSEEPSAATDEIARRVMHDFVLRQRYGVVHSQVTLEWLADAFDAILDGSRPQDALGLRARPNHRPVDSRHVGQRVAFWVRLTEQRGYTSAEAVGLAAECFSKDTKTIERYRRDNAAWADGMNPDADWESLFLADGRPLPQRRRKK